MVKNYQDSMTRKTFAKLDECDVPDAPATDFADCAWLFRPNERKFSAKWTIRMGVREAAMIYRYARGQDCAEIGRCIGGSTIVLATAAESLYSVDICPVDDAALDRALIKMRLRHKVTLIEADSGDHDPIRYDFGFLFIDGDHTYDGVRDDFDNWAQYVAVGGHIAFHDMIQIPGVKPNSVMEYYAEVSKISWIKEVEQADSTVVFRRIQ